MAVGDLLRVAIRGRLHSQTIIYTLQYRVRVVGAGNAAQVLAQQVDPLISDLIRAASSNEYTYLDTSAQKWYVSPTEAPFITSISTGVGGVAQNSLPTTVAATIRKRTANAGPRYRGRIFLCGIPVTYETDSMLNATGITAYTTATANVPVAITSAGFTFDPVLVHHDTVPPSWSLITSRDIGDVLRVQRRREIGKGV